MRANAAETLGHLGIAGERDRAHPIPVRLVDDRLVQQPQHFVEFAQRAATHRLGVGRLAVSWPCVDAGVTPEFAVVPRAAGIVPADEQAVAEHVVHEKPIDHRRIALEMLHGTVEACVENHPDLQLGGYDCRGFKGLHEGGRVADAGHRSIVHPTVDEIGKRNDGALLELRYAVGLEERVEVRLHLGEAGYVAVEDVPVGCVHRKRNDEYPAVRARDRTGIRVLHDRTIRLRRDDCRAAADHGCVGGDEGNVDVPVGMQLSWKAAGIEHQVVAFRRSSLELHPRADLHPGDIEHFRVDVARARAFVQQLRHRVGGQVIGVGHLLRREVMGEVPIAPSPSFECNSVLASPVQALLDGFVGKVRQSLQLLDQARPTAFTHSDDRDARVVYVVQLVVAVGVKTRHGGGRQRSRGSSSDDRDLPQRFSTRQHHLA